MKHTLLPNKAGTAIQTRKYHFSLLMVLLACVAISCVKEQPLQQELSAEQQLIYHDWTAVWTSNSLSAISTPPCTRLEFHTNGRLKATIPCLAADVDGSWVLNTSNDSLLLKLNDEKHTTLKFRVKTLNNDSLDLVDDVTLRRLLFLRYYAGYNAAMLIITDDLGTLYGNMGNNLSCAEEGKGIPDSLGKIDAPVPNPVRQKSTFNCALHRDCDVTFRIEQKAKSTIVKRGTGVLKAGSYNISVLWKDANDKEIAPGLYRLYVMLTDTLYKKNYECFYSVYKY